MTHSAKSIDNLQFTAASRVKSDRKVMWRVWVMQVVGIGVVAFIGYLGAIRLGLPLPF